MSDTTTERQANLATVRAFFDPNRTGPRTDLFTEDGSKENVFGPPAHIPKRLWLGRAELERNQREQPRSFVGTVIRDLRLYSGLDPAIVWTTTRFDEDCLMDGYSYPQDYVHFFRLEQGLIREWREFFDPYLFERSAAQEELPQRLAATPLSDGDVIEPAGSSERSLASAAVIKKFLDEPGNVDLWSQDAILEIPWRSPDYPGERIQGRDALRLYAQMWEDRLQDFCHENVAVYPTVDPDLVWATSNTGEATHLDGTPYRQRYVFAFRLRDEQIVLTRMYFDTLAYLAVSQAGEENGAASNAQGGISASSPAHAAEMPESAM